MYSLGVPIGTQHLFGPTSLHLVKTSTLVACVVPGLHNIILQFIFPDGYHFDAQYPNGQSEIYLDQTLTTSVGLVTWNPDKDVYIDYTAIRLIGKHLSCNGCTTINHIPEAASK
jgi:hypothetical protein